MSPTSPFASIHSALQSTFGVAVTIRRGSASVAVTANVGKTPFRLGEEFGYERVISRDYLIAADDYVLDGAKTEPARGDTIDETIGTTTRTHLVKAPGDEPLFKYSDPGRTLLRIHTDLVEQVTST